MPQPFLDSDLHREKNDPAGISEGEWFFLSGNSLFDLLDIDGSTVVEAARKRARE